MGGRDLERPVGGIQRADEKDGEEEAEEGSIRWAMFTAWARLTRRTMRRFGFDRPDRFGRVLPGRAERGRARAAAAETERRYCPAAETEPGKMEMLELLIRY